MAKTYLFQRKRCDALDLLANDSSYAWFGIGGGPGNNCKRNRDCSVVVAPFTTGPLGTGSGWMFKKRSPFLRIINHYYLSMKESGSVERLTRRKNRPEFDSKYYLPKQACDHYEGKPIGIHKASSIFAIMVVGIGLGFIFFA